MRNEDDCRETNIGVDHKLKQPSLDSEQISHNPAAVESTVHGSTVASLYFLFDVWKYLRVLARYFRNVAAFCIAVIIITCLCALLIAFAHKFWVSILPGPFRDGLALVFSFIFSILTKMLCRVPFINVVIPCPHTQFQDLRDLATLQEFSINTRSNNALTNLGTCTAADITRMTDQSLPDLLHLLEYSEITGKDAIMNVLAEIVFQGKPTARDLQKVGGAVQSSLDIVTAANRVYALRLQRDHSLSGYLLSSKKNNARLLWQALTLFSAETENIHTAFVAARDSLDLLQQRLKEASTIIQEELHSESQVRPKTLWNRITFYHTANPRDSKIHFLQHALNVTGEGLNHVSSTQVVIDVASDGFAFLKDRLGLYIDSSDPNAVELRYEAVVQSMRRLSDLRRFEGEERRQTP